MPGLDEVVIALNITGDAAGVVARDPGETFREIWGKDFDKLEQNCETTCKAAATFSAARPRC